MRKLTVLYLVAAIGLIGAVFGLSKSPARSLHSAVNTLNLPASNASSANEEVIDGAITPEKIPDHEAYIILFRLIARRETDEEKSRIRSYLKQALGCSKCKGLTTSENAD